MAFPVHSHCLLPEYKTPHFNTLPFRHARILLVRKGRVRRIPWPPVLYRIVTLEKHRLIRSLIMQVIPLMRVAVKTGIITLYPFLAVKIIDHEIRLVVESAPV